MDSMQRLKELKKEQAKLMKYLQRSQRSMNRNFKKLKILQREEEILLNPSLPGI